MRWNKSMLKRAFVGVIVAVTFGGAAAIATTAAWPRQFVPGQHVVIHIGSWTIEGDVVAK